jgi:hypothetical protein
MKLLTKEIEARLPSLYSTDSTGSDPEIIVKFFCPWSHWTWYATEGERTEDGDVRFFGMVHGFEDELGYFMLSELESIVGPAGLKIERDLHFHGKKLSDVA